MQAQTNFRKPLCIGLLAHVDAGKTTLSEGLLYAAGARRVLGRVDHGDALLDSFQLERQRGITIFSKQARLRTAHRAVTLIDTPGHVDFAAETERVLPALDCAVLVISGTDGVQAHTRTLWQLLRKHQVPVFLFINKMDLPGRTVTSCSPSCKRSSARAAWILPAVRKPFGKLRPCATRPCWRASWKAGPLPMKICGS